MPRGLTSTSPSHQLLDLLADASSVLIVTHDNPDPDAIASGWGLKVLIEELLGVSTRLVAGGAIVRAENLHMVELLRPPIELVDDLPDAENTAILLVDCGPLAANHLLARRRLKPLGVIDHHLPIKNGVEPPRLAFRDVRTERAASASIVADYLRDQGVDPGVKLATALLYAIHTDAYGCEGAYSEEDRDILPWLTERADPGLLAEIENAPLSRDYFGDLVLAMQNTFLYDDAALCLLPRASGAEIVGEVADLLIRCQGVRRVLCGAMVGRDLLLSARTSRREEHAAKLLQATIAGLNGSAGGHAHRAGGKLPNVGRGAAVDDELEAELRARWLAACNVDRQRGTRLVALREITRNL